MNWIEVSIIAERAAVTKIAALLDTMDGNGLTEEDINNDQVRLSWYTAEFISPEDAKTAVLAYLSKNESIGSHMFSLTAQVITEEMWMHGWQQYVEPIELLPHMVIKPSWQDYEKKAGETVIEIDSTLSFGTGDHETTQDCAKLLGLYGLSHKGLFLDIGTGTGVLLLVAAKLGFSELVGIDIDADSVAQANINCERNDVEATIMYADLSHDFLGKADFIMANLTVDPLKLLLPIVGNKLAKNGILVIGGIVDERYEEILPYICRDWQIKEHIHRKNWHTFALVRKEHEEGFY